MESHRETGDIRKRRGNTGWYESGNDGKMHRCRHRSHATKTENLPGQHHDGRVRSVKPWRSATT